MTDYSSDENIQTVGDKAMAGNLVGLVFDNERKLDRFLKKLVEKFPKVVIVDRRPMAQAGVMKNTILVRLRGEAQ